MTNNTKSARVSPLSLPRLLRESGHLAGWIVLATGMVLSVGAWFFTQIVVERDARFRFHSATFAVATTAQASIRSYSDLLYGLQGLFQAEPVVSRAAFDNYVYSLKLPVRYPGVRSVSYAHRVPASAKAKFERRLRRDPELIRRGYRNVVIKPAGKRSEYFVITYVEPLHANKTALGFDLASDEKRMVLVERARDTSMPTLSEGLVLTTDPTQSETGVVMCLALYRKDAFVPDVERRREAFVGLANVAFLVRELAQRILPVEGYEKFTFSIHDEGFVDSDSKPAPKELYSNAAFRPPQAGAVFTDFLYVDAGQRRWELKFSAQQGHFLRDSDHVLPWAALAAVLLSSLLLSGLIHSLAGSRQRAKRLAAQMTADLRESQARLTEEQRRTQELIEVLPNPVYFKATDGRYLGVNKAWETFFGMLRQAFLGKTVHDLYPGNPEIAQRLHADDQALYDHPGTRSYETTITTADGELHNTIYYKATFAGANGGIAGLIGTIIDITERKQAEESLKETLESLRKAVGATIQVMVSAVEARDPYTSGHQIRSADLARAIATEMGLSPKKIEGIRMAGSIHDIGKLSIPAEILSKPTKLSDIEFSLIKEHAKKGYEMLKDVESPWPLADIVHQHHERMDGSGYPGNLKGEEILIEARILAVADVVEAMASHRPYRPGLGIDSALNEIEKNRGISYDNAVADACLILFREKGFKLEELEYKR